MNVTSVLTDEVLRVRNVALGVSFGMTTVQKTSNFEPFNVLNFWDGVPKPLDHSSDAML